MLTLAGDGKRGAARQTLRIVAAGTAADGPGLVEILNLSVTGMLLQSTADLTVGELIQVQLPHAGLASATVVWSSGTFFGCRFDKPLSAAAISAAMLKSEPTPPASGRPGGEFEGLPFPAQMRRLRELHGLSLERLAQRLGVSRQTVWYWERGRSLPSPENLARLARNLQVGEADLMPDVPRAMNLAELIDSRKVEIAEAAGTTKDKVHVTIEF